MAADIREEALDTVRAQGGLAFNPMDKDCIMQIRKASSDGNGIAAVIDFVGSDKTFALSQSVLRRGGQAIQVSPCAPGPVSSTPLPRTGLELSPISELGVHPERATCDMHSNL